MDSDTRVDLSGPVARGLVNALPLVKRYIVSKPIGFHGI